MNLTYPGLTGANVLSFSGTEGVDAQPGRFTIVVDASVNVGSTGTLVFTDGVNTATIPGCRLVDAKWLGGGRYQVTLEDRRWRWAYGAVYGRYNVPRETAAGVKYEKTPRELADLLWDHMQETDLDTLLLPNDARPAVDWYGTNPADELIALLGSLGCVLAPTLTGGWKVWPINTGDVYAAPTVTMSPDVAQAYAVYPDAVAAITGGIQYEACFELEAVGEDTNGDIKPIDDLSYLPDGGWSLQDEQFSSMEDTYVKDGKTLNERDLARSCVYRWYRVKSLPAGSGSESWNPPGYPDDLPDVESLAQLLPLIPVINVEDETEGDANFGERKPAEVWGEYQRDENYEFNTRPGTKVSESFSIDAERGIVKFGSPIVRIVDGERQPAKLFLRCVVEAVQPDINIPAGYKRYQTTGLSNGTGTHTLFRDDVSLWWKPAWKVDGTLDPLGEGAEHPNNRDDVDAELDYYVNAELAKYTTSTSGTIRLGGVHLPQLNGVQTSVTWSMGSGQAPVTTIGVNSRANPYVADYKKTQQEKLTRSQQLQRERRQRLAQRKLYRGPV